MKKLFIVVIFFYSTGCFAQDKGYVGLSVGASNPIGVYGENDIDNYDAGFAQTGLLYDLSGSFKLGKKFGIAFLLRSQSNSVDTKEMEHQINEQYYYYNLGPVGAKVESDPVNSILIMTGGYGSIPLSEKLSFESRLLLGLMLTTLPEEFTSYLFARYPFSSKQKSSNAATLAFGAGVGLKYTLTSRICALANLDYTTAHPEFKDVEYENNYGEIAKDTFSQSISTINIGVGIGFRL